MKLINFIIFFSIFLTLYGLINFYIFYRGLAALPPDSNFRTAYIIIFWFFASAFIIGRVLERWWLSGVTDALVWIGSFWLAAMLYSFLFIFFLDLFRLFNHWFHFIQFSDINYQQLKEKIFISAIALISIVLFFGHLNAIHPRIKTLNLTINKAAKRESLKIVFASDIHLGTIIGCDRFCAMIDTINSLKPDLVLFPGDIVDEDLGPVIKQNLGEALKTIRAPLGVWSATGNHEYIGGIEPAVQYLSDHRSPVLRDSVVKVDDFIYIVGREDRSISQFTGKKRKSLSQIMQGVDRRYPIILMDHQPFQLHKAAENGVDLQISGHTHHGQLWPINLITNAIFEVSWGYKKIGETHYYVSCGIGTWGPPVRTNSRPEIVEINLTFTGQSK